MALKLKGSTSGFVAIDAPSVAGNNTLTLPENNGSAHQILANDITAGVTTFTQITVSRNGDLTVPGTISIGGTLTYEDVTSVDSVGIVTARGLSIFGNTTGLQVASGISTFQAVTATTGTFSAAVSGTTGTFSGDVSIADKIVHTGDTDTAIRFAGDDIFTIETGGSERVRVDSAGLKIPDKLLHFGDIDTAIRFPAADTVTVETGGSERIRIDSAGKFGIGQSPNTKVNAALSVFAATGDDDASDWGANGIFQLDHSGSAAVNNEVLLLGAVSGGVGQIASGFGFGRESTSNWGTYISFKTHSTGTSNIDELKERLRITSGGSLNIGNDFSQTTYKTQIEATNANVLRLVTDSDDANGVEFVLRKDSASPADEDNLGNIYFQGNDDSGAATFFSSIEAYSDDVSNGSENGYIRVRTRNDGTMAERLRVGSDGRVLMGTSSFSNISSNAVLTLKSSGSSATRLNLENSSSSSPESTQIFSQNNELAFVTSGAESLRIEADGMLKVKNNKGLNFANQTRTSTTNYNTTVTGEKFDYYEEGKMDPTAVSAGLTFDTSNNKQLRYVRIGHWVSVSGYLDVSSYTSNSNVIQVAMPFTSAGNSEGYYTRGVGAVMYRYVNLSTNYDQLIAYVGGGENYMRFFQSRSSSGDWLNLTNNNLASNSAAFYFSVNYMVA